MPKQYADVSLSSCVATGGHRSLPVKVPLTFSSFALYVPTKHILLCIFAERL